MHNVEAHQSLHWRRVVDFCCIIQRADERKRHLSPRVAFPICRSAFRTLPAVLARYQNPININPANKRQLPDNGRDFKLAILTRFLIVGKNNPIQLDL